MLYNIWNVERTAGCSSASPGAAGTGADGTSHCDLTDDINSVALFFVPLPKSYSP